MKFELEKIQTIVNSIGDGVVACDEKGKFIFYNSSAEVLLGPNVSGESPSEWTDQFGVFEEDQKTPFPQERYPLVLGLQGEETNGVIQFIRNPTRPEGVFISVSGRTMRDDQGKIIGSVAVFRDVSASKKKEEEIRNMNSSLREKNIELVSVNAELESFSYAVSHDLRTPLRSIIGFADLLQKKHSSALSAEALDYLSRIKESGNRLGQLIDGLLDLSRLSRGEIKLETVNISQIAREVIEELKSQEPERKVLFEVEDGLVAKADLRLLRSVLLNLLGNAWKFTSKKPEAKIQVGKVYPVLEKTTYFIKDNGAGFNQDYSKKLFNIFQRLHSVREFEGNGIGLATAQRVIRRHGGSIWAEGRPNEGAIFYFTL